MDETSTFFFRCFSLFVFLLFEVLYCSFIVQQNNRTISSNTSCVFWDFNENNGAGDWSEEGCKYAGATDDSVACECDHLTNFAVLMVSTTSVLYSTQNVLAVLERYSK